MSRMSWVIRCDRRYQQIKKQLELLQNDSPLLNHEETILSFSDRQAVCRKAAEDAAGTIQPELKTV